MDWEQKWREGTTPWDTGQPALALVDWLAAPTVSGGRAFVPGCGGGHDAVVLAKHGFTVTALDIAPTAVSKLQERGRALGLGREQLNPVLGDVLDPATARDLGRFDLIWEYTMLCALPPNRRLEWAAAIDRLMAPNAELLTLIFPTGPRSRPGPPFQLTATDLTELLTPHGLVAMELGPAPRSLPEREGLEIFARWRRGSP